MTDTQRFQSTPATVADYSAGDLAVVGMACRVPGANSPDQFWSLLRDGREARVTLGDEQLRAANVPQSLIDNPNYVKAGMFLQQMESFDPGFFGFSPLDGRIMDPQHRHFLECAWEALEDAGYDPGRFDGAIGVFAGSGHSAYLPYNLLTNPDLVAEVGFFLLRHTGNDKDFLATRASYCFDLKGPSINVQTACSTSLVAIHNAAQSLINGECDMALAGGVTIELPHHQGYLYKESEILSADGHCRPFDVSAGGTVFGSGVGVVVLRRMEDALAAGDNIHAVLRASAINNDGAGKVSYLAPSVDGQAAVIQEALAIADIPPHSVTYIETHGTGTQMGDPIEVAALSQAYGAGDFERQYCAIGSVKSNIGHLDTAAGVASFIKVVLAMKHRQLPATLHFRAPNAAIDFAESPFYVNAQLRPWDAPSPLRAGVSSLGVGGTNAHLIVEQAPMLAPSGVSRSRQLLLLSARSEQSLLRARDRLARHLETCCPELSPAGFADIAFTLAVGRRAFRKRAFLVAPDALDAVAALDAGDRDRIVQGEALAAAPKPAFMFAGGGAQYPDMGRGLYDAEPVFRAAVDECLLLLRDFIDYDLKPLLYPADDADRANAERSLERPSRTLPALFVTQYAQARLWQSWGVEPVALIGHSMGENTAACIAGVLSLRDALGLVALRGQLFERVGAGAMLSVEMDESALLPMLGADLCIAAVNAPGLSVASGPRESIEALEASLQAREIACRRIRIDVAAHSSMLDDILKPFGDYLRSIRLNPPRIPFISNRSGTWISAGEATDPEYWVGHLRNTVRFAEGVGKLLDSAGYVLLEVGPGRTLSSLAGLHGEKKPEQVILTSMRHPDDTDPDLAHMLGALGRLWVAGAETDWMRFYSSDALPDQHRRRVSLPTYAFDHQRCWVDPGTMLFGTAGEGRDAAKKGRSPADWLYQPVWKRTAPGPTATLQGARVLLLAASNPGAQPLLLSLQDGLQAAGAEVRVLRAGPSRRLDDSGGAALRWHVADDYVYLVERMQKDAWLPTHILHTIALDVPAGTTIDIDASLRALVFDSMFHLAQAAAQEDWQDLQWLVLSPQAQQVAGEPLWSALPALALGPVRVLPREFPSWSCQLVDIESAAVQGANARIIQHLAGLLIDELAQRTSPGETTAIVALRGNARFSLHYLARADAAAGGMITPALRADGVYVISGGTGGLGLVAARTLADAAADAGLHITIVVLARRPLPERRYWSQLIDEDAPEANLLRQLQQFENGAAQLLFEVGDVNDGAAMVALAARLRQQLGGVHGLIHMAGVIDDGLLLGKDIQQAIRVLAPKVQGTLALDAAFDGNTLDFFVLYSSTSAFAGMPGQTDYAAANAFLDAYAHLRCGDGANFIAINWPAWRGAGMAAALADGRAHRRLPAGRPVPHPLIDRCIAEDDVHAVFVTDFSVPEYWLLNEHRIKDGPALIPGAGFIELARAAWQARRDLGSAAQDVGVEIRDIAFDLPFIVGDSEHKTLQIAVRDTQDGTAFTFSSESFGDTVEHARGLIGPIPAAPGTAAGWRPAPLDIEAIRSRCTLGEQRFDDPDHHPFLDFGKHWQALRLVRYGQREALIELEIAPSYLDELGQYGIHPALFDMAAAGAQVIIDNHEPREELYVPVGCKLLRFSGAFPAKFHSHVVFKPAPDARHSHDIATFDATLCDAENQVFLQVSGFTMRRIPDTQAFRQLGPRAEAAVPPALARTLELGISVDEGARTLLNLLQLRRTPQTIVSPFDLDYLRSELLALSRPQPIVEVLQHDADADPDIPRVESALCALPALHQVVVRAFEEDSGERRFVAYFVPDHAHFSTASEVRRFAREQLPLELQPQQLVELDELPCLADGSIDRKALRDPLAPQDTYLAPRTGTEKSLARIWQEVLGVDRVGLADNFFDLGGHSLLSTRVIVQIYKRLGARLDQATMVLNTLEQIARDVDQRTGKTAEPGLDETDPGVSQAVAATSVPEPKPAKSRLRALFGGKS